jgi:hypothetical protein
MKIYDKDTVFAKDAIVAFKGDLYTSLADDNTGNSPDEEDSEFWVLRDNPFAMVHRALWDMLEASDAFCELVPEGNRIKFYGEKRAPQKDTVMADDLPEVRIVSMQSTTTLTAASNLTATVRRFQIEIASGDQRFNTILFPVEWEVYLALLSWRETLGALKWADKQFVTRASLVQEQEGKTTVDLLRGIKGWTAIWAIDVAMYFNTSDLVTNEEDTP